ncbi:phospholipase D family protein [Thauera butanivorans]|uniref:phospholipase D family protein n=1 Tax=Thauera butanivorans TaxID=86174 RepID=UPI000B2BCA4A|nr:phospholipase D family protein [Thauera butanivorans]
MIRFIVLACLCFVAASVLATWLYGIFAARVQGEVSHALPVEGGRTLLDRQIGAATDAHPGKNGLILLAENLDAFAARGLSARKAERSLDLMYYIWHEDLTGRLLLAEALAAAGRGVRVRILIDDIGTSHTWDAMIAMAHHPQIEIRIFNPTRAREGSLRRGIEMALRAFSVTRRMHNKAWIVDGRIAILGGRNIGDEYFDAAEETNFRDMDVLVMGPVVAQAETIFDDYWNSGVALPIDRLSPVQDPRAALERIAPGLSGTADEATARPYLQRLVERLSLLDPGAEQPHWTANARIIADPPQKALGRDGENWLMHELRPVFEGARERLEITSPYFIPGEQGTAILAAIAARGVSVSVLTNSLAATDVAAVHGGYARYRVPLLEAGIRLWELRPEDQDKNFSLRGSSGASLHTKAFSADGRVGFIGSMNLDPRSTSLNTEMGVLFDSGTLVARMEAVWQRETAPSRSYEVRLTPQGRLEWSASRNGEPVRYDREPETSLPRRLAARIIGMLPLESQL